MVRYSRFTKPRPSAEAEEDGPFARVRGRQLKAKAKKMIDIASAIRGKTLTAAIRLLEDVIVQRRGIAARVHTGGCGRHGQGKMIKAPGNCVMFPTKPTKVLLGLLQNLIETSKRKGYDADKLRLVHVQVNRAPKTRRRTYRAHGRIGPYMANPCHVEIVGVPEDKVGDVVKAEEKEEFLTKLTRKQAAQTRDRVAVGGGH